jgi:hypothetical protein
MGGTCLGLFFMEVIYVDVFNNFRYVKNRWHGVRGCPETNV